MGEGSTVLTAPYYGVRVPGGIWRVGGADGRRLADTQSHSSAPVLWLGSHVHHRCRVQARVALSTGEAERYAPVRGPSKDAKHEVHDLRTSTFSRPRTRLHHRGGLNRLQGNAASSWSWRAEEFGHLDRVGWNRGAREISSVNSVDCFDVSAIEEDFRTHREMDFITQTPNKVSNAGRFATYRAGENKSYCFL